jgi:glycosyltransferase involved in cell wall biosynthesis
MVVAGRLDAATGGSRYNRRMAEKLRQRGWVVDVHEIDVGFPFPTADGLRRAAGVLAGIQSGSLVLVDGLAFGVMPAVVADASARLRLIALVHLPLAATVGLDSAAAGRLQASERRALSSATRVIVTGAATVSLMDELGLSHDHMLVVEPGTDAAPLAKGSPSAGVQIVTVATLNPGKGHQILIEALATLRDQPWRLTCAGSVTRHPATVAAVRATIVRLELEQRVSLVGELNEPDLAACYDAADLFVLASLRETYGMAVAEALARGLPVVGTATGAIPALVGDEAGIVVPPGDRDALAQALSSIVGDVVVRERCAAGARRVRARLPGWDEAAARLTAALEMIDTHG